MKENMSKNVENMTMPEDVEDISTSENVHLNFDVNNGLENVLPNFTIVLKSKKWFLFSDKIECNDYSPYWIVHPVSGHTELSIRAFDVLSDKIYIVSWNNIKTIIHESGATEQLDDLNARLEREAQVREEKANRYMKDFENYKKEIRDGIDVA